MGRPPKVKAPPVVAARPPMMKYAEAVKLADKNARTIMKISQLMVRFDKLTSSSLWIDKSKFMFQQCLQEVIHMPGHALADPKDRIGLQIGMTLNTKLALTPHWNQ